MKYNKSAKRKIKVIEKYRIVFIERFLKQQIRDRKKFIEIGTKR